MLPPVQGWGFDFEWRVHPEELALTSGTTPERVIQAKMEECVDAYLETTAREDREELNVSPTQMKKQMVMEEKLKRKLKQAKRLARSQR